MASFEGRKKSDRQRAVPAGDKNETSDDMRQLHQNNLILLTSLFWQKSIVLSLKVGK